jgi:hypothetical protein
VSRSTNLFDSEEQDEEMIQRRRSLFEDQAEEGEKEEEGKEGEEVKEMNAKQLQKRRETKEVRKSLFEEEDERGEEEGSAGEEENENGSERHDSDPSRLRSHSAILVDNHKVLIFSAIDRRIHIFLGRERLRAMCGGWAQILVFGGYDGKQPSNDLWVLHTTPGKMKWKRPLTSGLGPRPLDSHTAVTIQTSFLL